MSVAEAFVTIRPDTRGFGASLQNETRGPLSRMSDTVTKWGQRAFRAAGVASGVAMGAAMWGGLQRTLDTEDARKLFGQLGLGVSEIDGLMGDLNETFLTGPFAYPDVYDVSSQLMASGVEMDKLVGYTEAVGNMAAFAGADLAHVGEITQVIGANGRVTARELNRLGQMGIPIRQILAEALGVSGDELSNMVSAGELSSDMFFELIGDAEQFEGAMDSFGSTTRGAWSIFKAGVAGVGEAFLAPWFGENGTAVGFLNSLNDVIFDRVQPAIASFSEWLKDAVEAVRPFATTAREWITGFFEALSSWWTEVGQPAWSAFVEMLQENWPVIQSIFDSLGRIVQSVGEIFSTEFSSMSDDVEGDTDTIVGVLEGLIVTLDRVLDTTATVTEGISGSWNLTTGILTGDFDKIGRGLDDLEQGSLTRFGESVRRITSEAQGHFANFTGSTLISIAIWGAEVRTRAAVAMAQFASSINRAIEDVVQWFRELPGRIGRAIMNNLSLFGTGEAIMDSLASGMRSSWRGTSSWLSGLGAGIQAIKGPMEKDRVLLLDQGRAIMDSLGQGMEERWRGSVSPLLNDVTAAIPAAVGSPAPAGRGGMTFTGDIYVRGQRDVVEVEHHLRTIEAAYG